ncbi:MAG: ribonuclease E/G [Candidatus Binatia bacterium]
MRKQIIVNVSMNEVRVALLENGILAEIHIKRSSEEAAAGNIYKGKVTRVLPGMQAAFVDLGLEKAAFLHTADVLTPGDNDPSDETGDDAVQYEEPRSGRDYSPIEKKIRRGDEIIVQIAKEPIGTKGARITSYVSMPGKYLVLMPSGGQIGVSKRIVNEKERRRLRDIVQSAKPRDGGIIVRTSCVGLPREDVLADVNSLVSQWNAIREKAAEVKAPALLHSDLDLVLRCVRDMLSREVDEIAIDSQEDYGRVKRFVSDFLPDASARVEHYSDLKPIYDHYGIEAQINRAIEPKVWLKSGGYLVIDQGEALTMIDVNTGRFVGRKSQEETVLKTNLEAASAVVEQLRLRNIGGIIIIDFIDMEENESRRQVTERLERELAADRARTSILRISELGLVQMTRKRTRENLERLLSTPCSYCDGRGRIKSVPTVAHEILRNIQKEAARSGKPQSRVTVRASREVISYLYNEEERSIKALQRRLDRRVTLQVAEKYHQEQFDIVAA